LRAGNETECATEKEMGFPSLGRNPLGVMTTRSGVIRECRDR